jgi:hypothetical protein
MTVAHASSAGLDGPRPECAESARFRAGIEYWVLDLLMSQAAFRRPQTNDIVTVLDCKGVRLQRMDTLISC